MLLLYFFGPQQAFIGIQFGSFLGVQSAGLTQSKQLLSLSDSLAKLSELPPNTDIWTVDSLEHSKSKLVTFLNSFRIPDTSVSLTVSVTDNWASQVRSAPESQTQSENVKMNLASDIEVISAVGTLTMASSKQHSSPTLTVSVMLLVLEKSWQVCSLENKKVLRRKINNELE